MQDQELLDLWKSYDKKMNDVLSLNKQIAHDLTKTKLNRTVNQMRIPKITALLLGIPYTLFLYILVLVAYKAGWVFPLIGFGAIALTMSITLGTYFYHLFLIHRINISEDILLVQKKLSNLKISSIQGIRIAVLQLPFWSISWISLTALKGSPLLYGGVNLIVFLGLVYLAYWLYDGLAIQNRDSKISRFFLSGVEWTPIVKSSEILAQLKEYK